MTAIYPSYLRFAIVDLVFIDMVIVGKVLSDVSSGGLLNLKRPLAFRKQAGNLVELLIQLVLTGPSPSVHPTASVVRQWRRHESYGRGGLYASSRG